MGGQVQLIIDGAIATVTLSNPNKRNATSLAMYAAIPETARQIRSRKARVVVLRGEGAEAFGAGSDIEEFSSKRRGAAAVEYNRIEHEATVALDELPVPLIACIHGPCMGGGLGLALCADLRYAADDATFGVPPGRLGLGYPYDSAARLVNVIGAARARELLMTARRVSANEAASIGLVHAVVEKAQLDAHVANVARQAAALAPMTLAAAKATFQSLAHPHDAVARANAESLIVECFASADYAEGIDAFMAKRAPQFRGE